MLICKQLCFYLLLSCATRTAVWQNGGFSAKFKFSSSIELLHKTEHLCFDFRRFAKPQNVIGNFIKMEHKIIPVESIQERDVDIILLEELATDITFCEWFVNEMSLPEFTSLDGAWRSITDFGLGETDILFSYFSKEKRIYILIENKLDANFQNEQYVRYENRAYEYINKKICDESYCVLTAPKLYCENQNQFCKYVTYENIADRLERIGSIRSIFKSELLKIGSEKLRRGYHPINSLPVQNFWISYWNFKQEFFPEFYMKKPSIVPQNSDWPMLYEDSLPNIVFYHKLAQGNVDATFKNYAEEIEFKVKEILPNWLNFEKHNKSFSLRIQTEKIDRFSNFSDQIIEVKSGLEKLSRIRNWLLENKNCL